MPIAGPESSPETTGFLVAAFTGIGTAAAAFVLAIVRGWKSEDKHEGSDSQKIDAVAGKPVFIERADLSTIGDLPVLIRELTPMLREAYGLEKANAEALSRCFKELLAGQENILRRIDRNEERSLKAADGVARLVQELDWAQRQRQEDLLRIAREVRHE